MIDTTPIAVQITRLIAIGVEERTLLATVAHLFPNLTSAELSQALQMAQETAERRVARKH